MNPPFKSSQAVRDIGIDARKDQPKKEGEVQRRYLDRDEEQNRERQQGRQYLRELSRASLDILSLEDHNEVDAQFGRVRDRQWRANGLALTLPRMLKYCYSVLRVCYEMSDYVFDIHFVNKEGHD